MHLKGCLRQADIQDILRRRHAWHHILDNTYLNSVIHRQPSSHHARLRAFTFCDDHAPHPHHRASPDPTYHVFGAFRCSKRPIDRHIHHLNTVTALGMSVSASVSTLLARLLPLLHCLLRLRHCLHLPQWPLPNWSKQTPHSAECFLPFAGQHGLQNGCRILPS